MYFCDYLCNKYLSFPLTSQFRWMPCVQNSACHRGMGWLMKEWIWSIRHLSYSALDCCVSVDAPSDISINSNTQMPKEFGSTQNSVSESEAIVHYEWRQKIKTLRRIRSQVNVDVENHREYVCMERGHSNKVRLPISKLEPGWGETPSVGQVLREKTWITDSEICLLFH